VTSEAEVKGHRGSIAVIGTGLLHVGVVGKMATVAVAVLLGSATDVAVTVGTVAGAVYFPFESIVPHAAPLHPAPDRLQVTPLFMASFWTVGVNCCVVLTCTDAVTGETLTTMAGGAAALLLQPETKT
jgi:hypothetical protein